MSINVNKVEAGRILAQAFSNQCQIDDDLAQAIRKIILGKELTHRYIIITALLGRATDGRANPLVLQAQSELEGAYDARSICHEVLVPFERQHLGNALGGSNEPYLNKPARYTEVSVTNAARKGVGVQRRDNLISLLTTLGTKTKEEAFQYLSYALVNVQERAASQGKKLIAVDYSPTLLEVYDFVKLFLQNTLEGETCVLIVGALEKLYYDRLGEGYVVKAHKVNQSGASSRETGDIDIFLDDKLLCAIEVKDKNFNQHDLEHAFAKMRENGMSKGEFIFGLSAHFEEEPIYERISQFEKDGFFVLFHHILPYARMMLYKIDLDDKSEFLAALLEIAGQIKCKDKTLAWIHESTEQLGWVANKE